MLPDGLETSGRRANFGIFLEVFEFLRFGWFFPFFKKIGFWGILGPPSYGIGATIRTGREMLCLPYAGFLMWDWNGPLGFWFNILLIEILPNYLHVFSNQLNKVPGGWMLFFCFIGLFLSTPPTYLSSLKVIIQHLGLGIFKSSTNHLAWVCCLRLDIVNIFVFGQFSWEDQVLGGFLNTLLASSNQ